MSSYPLEVSPTQCRAIRFGAFEVDLQVSELRRAGTRVKIDNRSFQILLLLLKRGGEIVSREELRQHLWAAGANMAFDCKLNQAVSKLRSIISDSADKPRFIETIQNRGYRFISTLIFTDESEPSSNSAGKRDKPETDRSIGQMSLAAGDAKIVSFGPFEFDLQSFELRKRGVLVSIHQQPVQILLLLLHRHGQIVRRDEICQCLWPNAASLDVERNLNNAIFKLRDALGDSVVHPLFVETVPARGYRFVSPVKFVKRSSDPELPIHVSAGELSERSEKPDEGAMATIEAPVNSDAVDKHDKARQKYCAIACLVVLIILAAFFYVQLKPPTVVAGSEHANRRIAIEVADFKNLSGEPRDAWLTTALSEGLSLQLDTGGQLLVVSPASITGTEIGLSAQNVDLPLPDATRPGKSSAADYVLGGSYGALGKGLDAQIRIDAFLQDVKTGQKIATVSQTGRQADLWKVISDIGNDLRAHLGVRKLNTEETQFVASAFSSDPDAVRLYAEGMQQLRAFDAQAATVSLAKAIAADQNNALAHDALAAAWFQLGNNARCGAEARKAFELSAGLPRSQRLLLEGHYQQTLQHWDRAIQIYHALFEFFPDNPQYGVLLVEAELRAGQQKDAMETVQCLKRLQSPLRNDPRIDFADKLVTFALRDENHGATDMQMAHK